MTTDKPYHDKREQLDKIQHILMANEEIWAVYDMKGGGTGFVGVTNKRVIVFDKVFLRKMKAIVSIPFSRIQSVAAEDDGNFIVGRGIFSSSKVILSTSSGQHEFEFRGADKAHHAHNLILSQMV